MNTVDIGISSLYLQLYSRTQWNNIWRSQESQQKKKQPTSHHRIVDGCYSYFSWLLTAHSSSSRTKTIILFISRGFAFIILLLYRLLSLSFMTPRSIDSIKVPVVDTWKCLIWHLRFLNIFSHSFSSHLLPLASIHFNVLAMVFSRHQMLISQPYSLKPGGQSKCT